MLAVACSACTSVNHYASPSLLAPGKISVVVAAGATEVQRERKIPPFGTARTTSRALVLYPTLMGRFGVLPRLELGGSLTPGGVGAEAKVGLLTGGPNGEGIRLAVLAAPALQGGAFVVDAPVLVGLPLHERVELVASPGVAYAKPLVPQSRSYPSGVLARGGLAVFVRIAKQIALVPELTASTALHGDTRLWATAGLGLRGDVR